MIHYMTSYSLDFSSLDNAVNQLQVAVEQSGNDLGNELKRDGAIQRFEYTYELCIKFIKRVLETVYADSVDTLAYRDLLRTAAERGLIEDVEQWFLYRDARNKTSHTYEGSVAADVYRVIPVFLPDSQKLLTKFHEL